MIIIFNKKKINIGIEIQGNFNKRMIIKFIIKDNCKIRIDLDINNDQKSEKINRNKNRR